jgi:hypothetical protein
MPDGFPAAGYCDISTSSWADALDIVGLASVLPELPLRAGAGPVIGPAITVLEQSGLVGSFALEEFAVAKIIAGCDDCPLFNANEVSGQH